MDERYWAYSAYTGSTESGIWVKCPKCGGLGIVTADRAHARFKCVSCGASREKGRARLRYDVENQCAACGRYYRVGLTDPARQHFRVLNVACPHCGHVMPGRVRATDTKASCWGEVRAAVEPCFGYELWFSTHFRGKTVWALNRKHLNYLIEYLSAGLREKPVGFGGQRTQADHLPTFMKTAKNRKRIVKLLREMQGG